MKKFLILLGLVLCSTLGFSQAKFIASGLTCSMCSKAIHDALKQDTSVVKIDVNLSTQVWKVDYKPGTVFTKERILKPVEDAGFSVSQMWYKDMLILNRTKKKLRVWSL